MDSALRELFGDPATVSNAVVASIVLIPTVIFCGFIIYWMFHAFVRDFDSGPAIVAFLAGFYPLFKNQLIYAGLIWGALLVGYIRGQQVGEKSGRVRQAELKAWAKAELDTDEFLKDSLARGEITQGFFDHLMHGRYKRDVEQERDNITDVMQDH